NGQWYLQGWCHMRQAMRTFHLDRVSLPELTDIAITHAEDHLPEAFSTIGDDAEVLVRVPERMLPLLGDYARGENTHTQDGFASVRIRMSDPRSIKRVAGRFGGALEVQEPAIARTAAREWAVEGLA